MEQSEPTAVPPYRHALGAPAWQRWIAGEIAWELAWFDHGYDDDRPLFDRRPPARTISLGIQST